MESGYQGNLASVTMGLNWVELVGVGNRQTSGAVGEGVVWGTGPLGVWRSPQQCMLASLGGH